MKIMVLWFILAGGFGYIEPVDVYASSCGLASSAPAGLFADREVNPRIVRWSNCEINVAGKVATLQPGVYHLAATGLGPYNAPDPHTSSSFVVSADFEEQTAARPTDKFEWTMAEPLSTAQGYRYELELDGVVQGAPLVHSCAGSATPATCSAPIPAITPGTHSARVRAVDASVAGSPITGEFSDAITFTMRATPGKPANVRVGSGS